MGQSAGRPEVGEVKNLTATLQPNHECESETFVVLQWEAPSKNIEDKITAYDVRFRPEGEDAYHEESVDGCTKIIILTKAAGIKPLTTYNFEVRARIEVAEGKWKAVAQYIALAPGPVQNLTAAVDACKPSVTLNWDPQVNQSESGDPITKYDVRFELEEGEHYSEKTIDASTTSIVLGSDLGLKPLLKYDFKVRARNAYIAGRWETVKKYIALNPDPVQNLTATVNPSAPSLELTWDPPANATGSGDVTKYHICFKLEGKECYDEMTVDGSTTSMVLTRDSGLVPQTTYDFGVRAQSGDDIGEWERLSAYIGLVPGPVDLSVDMDPHEPSLTLNWERPSNIWNAREVVAYEIHLKSSETVEYEERSESCYTTSVTFTRESGLVPLTTYDFQVRARSEDGAGEWTKVSAWFADDLVVKKCSDIAAHVPDIVQNLTITDVDENYPSITLAWEPPENVKSDKEIAAYEVRFKPVEGDYVEKTVDSSTASIVLTSGPSAMLKLNPESDHLAQKNPDSEPSSFDSIVFTKQSGLIPLSTSIFEVRASNNYSAGEWARVSAYIALDPDPVINLSVDLDSSVPSVTLTWDPPTNAFNTEMAAAYRYQICIKPEGVEQCYEMTVDGSTTSVVLTRELGLEPRTMYHFQVRPMAAGVAGDWRSASAYFALVPGPVENLIPNIDSSQPSVMLSWKPPANSQHDGDVNFYEIRFEPSENGDEVDNGASNSSHVPYQSHKIEDDTSTTSVILTRESAIILTRESGPIPLTTTTFQVRAENADGKGEWTTVSTYVALVPGPVQNLKRVVDSKHVSVKLSWDPPLNFKRPGEVTAYRISFQPKGRNKSDEMIIDQSSTSYLLTRDSGLIASTMHTFSVRAQNSETLGEWKSVTAYVALHPDPVRNLSVTIDEYVPAVTLSWIPPVNIQSDDELNEYHIHCYGNEHHDGITFRVPATSIILTRESGLVPLENYHFQVRAQSGNEEGEWKQVSAYYGLVPGQVQNLKSTLDTKRPSLTLNWDKPNNVNTAKDVTAYDVRFRPSENRREDSFCKMTLKAPATSILLTRQSGLKSLVKYDFEVRAQNEKREGKWSTISEYTALTPNPVQNLTASVDAHKPSVSLKWDPPANAAFAGDVTKYQICFWHKEKGYYNEKIVDGSATTTVITRESGLRTLTTCEFQVRAYSGDDVSRECKTVSTFVALIPDPVGNLKIHLDSGVPSVTLTWTPPQNTKAGTQSSHSDVSRYHIRFKPKERQNYDMIEVDSFTTSVDFSRESGLVSHKTFVFEVRAQCGDALGQWKAVSKFIYLVPGEVQILKSTLDTTVPSLTLNWDKPSNAKSDEDVTAYDIRFPLLEAGRGTGYHTLIVKAPATSILLTRQSGLKPLMKYEFEVRSRNAECKGKWSTVSEYIALTPEPVQNLRATVDKYRSSVRLDWDPPSNAAYAGNVTKYHICFWDKEKGCYREKIVDGSTTTAVLTRESGLRPLSLSTFEVRARSGDDVSQECRTVSAFVALVPDPVQNLNINVDMNVPSVTVTWDPPPNVRTETQSSWSDVSRYHIRFKPERREHYNEITVDNSTTSIVLNKESGIIPQTTSVFEVRAQSGDFLGHWKKKSRYVGLIPGNVQLQAISNGHDPSLTLRWEMPSNISTVQEITAHEIQFKQHHTTQNSSGHQSPSRYQNPPRYQKLSQVDGHCREVTLGRKDGLRPLIYYDLEVRAISSDGAGPWTPITKYFSMIPDPIQNLRLTMDRDKPSLTLNWEPPSNVDFNNPDELTHYDIFFKPEGQQACTQMTVPRSSTTLTLTRKSGLVLDPVCQFSVRAQNRDQQAGVWISVTQLIAWSSQCRLPGCTKRRQERPDKTVNDFCCKEHARQFAGLCCLYGNYPGCQQNKPTPVGAEAPADFCEKHLQQALEEGYAGVVELESNSQEYKKLCKKFCKDWDTHKGICPPIITIVKIINPMISERFARYRAQFVVYQGIEQHYHGTTLCCDLADYAELCDDPRCGACGITRKGFDPQRINSAVWQRFGQGFYFAKNSSKSYDYAAGNRIGAKITDKNTRYNAIFLCDIAPGRKYGIRYRSEHLPIPPPGYDSFHGKSKGVMKQGELNYDELVIFDYKAVRPRYIIFC